MPQVHSIFIDPSSVAPACLAVIQSAIGKPADISLGCEQRCLAILQRAERAVLVELFSEACAHSAALALELAKVNSRG